MTHEYLDKAIELADNLRGARNAYKDIEKIIGIFQKAESFRSLNDGCIDAHWTLRKVDEEALSKAMAEAAIAVLKDMKEQVNKDIATFEEQFEAL